jgi:predicted negative regulator of RcsB-dependent stress response
MWLTVGVVAAVVVVGALLWRNFQHSRDMEAQKQFAEALETYHANVIAAGAPAPKDQPVFNSETQKYQQALAQFTKVYQRYSSHKIGLLARYYMALCQHALNKNEEAVRILTELQSSSDGQFRSLVRSALADIYRATGKNEQALQQYQAILRDPESKFPKDALLMSMAQTAEALGRHSEAVGYYQRLTREHAQSVYSAEARSHLDSPVATAK